MNTHLLTPSLHTSLAEQGYRYLKLLSVEMSGTERNLIYEPALYIDHATEDKYKAINDAAVRNIIQNEVPHIHMFIQMGGNEPISVAAAS